MTVKHLLENNSDPSENEIRGALSGNLCRCTGYKQMYQAMKERSMRSEKVWRRRMTR